MATRNKVLCFRHVGEATSLGSGTDQDPGQLVIADILERVLNADNAFCSATTIRTVRSTDQADDDDRTWEAAKLPSGRYHVRGNYFHTYTDDELDILDTEALAVPRRPEPARHHRHPRRSPITKTSRTYGVSVSDTAATLARCRYASTTQR